MSEGKPPAFDFSNAALLQSALHSQLLARRRATLEHDVKNVVHGLLSGTELLAKSLNTTPARVTPAECLALLQQQLTRAQATLTRILDEVAPPAQESGDIDVAELVGEVTHALRHQLQLLNVQIDVPPGLRIRGLRARIKDVLLCIVLDCADRSPVRARIAIQAERCAEEHLRLRVKHTQGAATQLPAIAATMSPLLELDHGRIEVKDVSQHERAVDITLPLHVAAAEAALDLMFVDANRDAADSLVMLVQLEGLTAEARYDAAAALEVVRLRTPGTVVLDLDGSVDSRSLVRTIRSSSEPRPRLLGIAHSPADTREDLDAVLRKPLDVAALRNAMR